MSNKEASIRLTLNNQPLVQGLRNSGEEAEKAGSKIGKALNTGFEAGKKSVGDLFNSVKSLIGLGAVLGGAFSFREGIQHALDMETKYRAVAREIKELTGNTVSLQRVQEDVAEAGRHTTVSIEALTDSFLELMKTTGNADYSSAAMRVASQEATRTGKSFESLSSLAGNVNRKFGITSDRIGEVMRMITANTDIGGPRLDELANGFDMLGAVAESGGLKGQDGLEQLLGMLNKTAPVLGRFNESSRALNGVFSALQAPEAFNKIKALTAGDGGKFMKNLIDAPDALKRLDLILKKGGVVRKEFEHAITDRKELALYKILTEPFDKSVAAATAAGKKGEEALEAGSAAYKASLEGLTRAGDSKASADRELAERMATSKAKLDQAMKELEDAFAQPEVKKAIKDLMGLMPDLVKVLSKVIEFAAKHPALAMAAVPAVNASGAIAGAGLGALGGAALKGGKGLLSWLGWGGGEAAVAAEGAAAASGTAAATAAGGTAATVAAGGAVAAEGAAAGGVAVAAGEAGIIATVGAEAAAAGTVVAEGAAAAGAAVATGIGAVVVTPVAAVVATGAAVMEALELHDVSQSEGGILSAISEAFSRGGELGGHASTPEEYDEIMAKQKEADKQRAQSQKEVHDILARSAGRAADALERLGRSTSGTGGGGSVGDGVSKGPGAPGSTGGGWYSPENMSR